MDIPKGVMAMSFFEKITYRLSAFFKKIFSPLKDYKTAFKYSGLRGKLALVLSALVMGFGHIILGFLEKGLLYIVFEAVVILIWLKFGVNEIIGKSIMPSQALRVWAIIFLVALTLVFIYSYLRSIGSVIQNLITEEKTPKNIILNFFKNQFKKTGAFFQEYAQTYQSSPQKIKASMVLPFFVMGSGHLLQRQITKGLLYLAGMVLFIVYMLTDGITDLQGLITLHTEGVRSDYSIIYGLLCLAIILAFVIVYIKNIKGAKIGAQKLLNNIPVNLINDIKALKGPKFYITLLTLPIIGILAFTVLPLLFMILLAFTDYAFQIGTVPSIINDTWLSWTGFDSFRRLFDMGEYFKALTNVVSWTFVWAFFATFTCYFGGMFLAILINKKQIKGKIFFRSLFLLTIAIPQLVTLRVMYAMFHDYGPINSLLMKWGWINRRIQFWGNTAIAKTLIILINMWVGVPYFMILMTGLLMNIPKDLYEYSRIDGASAFQQFRYITLPYIMFMTGPLLIANFVSNINNFNVIWLLTGGGPEGAGTGGVAGGTDILITWLYKLTMMDNPKYNIGSAIGLIMFIISASLSIIIYRRSSSYQKEEDFS